jgi:hypothetical protein
MTYDTKSGACLSCYPGYNIAAGNCIISTTGATTSFDPNCKTTDSFKVCQSCYEGYFLTQGKTCSKKDTLCKTYDANFACATCYDGYKP